MPESILESATAPIIDLSLPDNTELVRGRSILIELLWYFLGAPLVASRVLFHTRIKCAILRLFGARVGKGVAAKPGLRVKFPWYLEVGDHTWLGEDLWIDNLAPVRIGSNVCVSQGVYLCTGNHDWSVSNMRLFRRPITLQDGCWVCARAVVCPGVTVEAGAILTVNSVATKDIPAFEVHTGHPAQLVCRRTVREAK